MIIVGRLHYVMSTRKMGDDVAAWKKKGWQSQGVSQQQEQRTHATIDIHPTYCTPFHLHLRQTPTTSPLLHPLGPLCLQKRSRRLSRPLPPCHDKHAAIMSGGVSSVSPALQPGVAQDYQPSAAGPTSTATGDDLATKMQNAGASALSCKVSRTSSMMMLQLSTADARPYRLQATIPCKIVSLTQMSGQPAAQATLDSISNSQAVQDLKNGAVSKEMFP